MLKLKDEEGNTLYGREKIVKIAARFDEKVKDQGHVLRERNGNRGGEEEEEEGPEIPVILKKDTQKNSRPRYDYK